jgi:hypothetical protein
MLRFLMENRMSWILPICIALALLAWLAWSITSTPESPFAYRLD